MATRVVEGKRPYTGGKAITVDENRVISLNLRGENNLIIWDEGDNEIYVDLQIPDGRTPIDAFPIGVNTGRVSSEAGWDVTGTIISAETTSGDNIKILYGDDGTLWINHGEDAFKQIYFKGDVDSLLQDLRTYIDGQLALKQDGVTSDTEPTDPTEGMLWYDTTESKLKVYDGTQWNEVGTGGAGTGNVVGPSSATDGHLAVFDGTTGKIIKDGGAVPEGVPSGGNNGDVLTNVNGTPTWQAPSGGGDVTVSQDAGNTLTTGAGLRAGTEANYQNISTPDSNTLYFTF